MQNLEPEEQNILKNEETDIKIDLEKLKALTTKIENISKINSQIKEGLLNSGKDIERLFDIENEFTCNYFEIQRFVEQMKENTQEQNSKMDSMYAKYCHFPQILMALSEVSRKSLEIIQDIKNKQMNIVSQFVIFDHFSIRSQIFLKKWIYL